MPNRYKDIDSGIISDLIEEEDREVENDLYRAQTEYYRIQSRISQHILDSLNSMSKEEIKDIIKNTGIRIPVRKL